MPPSIYDLFLILFKLRDYTWVKVYSMSSITISLESPSTLPFIIETANNIVVTLVHYFTFQTLIVNAASMFTAVTGVIFLMFASSSIRDKEVSIVKNIH